MKAEDLTISDKLSILENALQLYKSVTLHSTASTSSNFAGLCVTLRKSIIQYDSDLNNDSVLVIRDYFPEFTRHFFEDTKRDGAYWWSMNDTTSRIAALRKLIRHYEQKREDELKENVAKNVTVNGLCLKDAQEKMKSFIKKQQEYSDAIEILQRTIGQIEKTIESTKDWRTNLSRKNTVVIGGSKDVGLALYDSNGKGRNSALYPIEFQLEEGTYANNLLDKVRLMIHMTQHAKTRNYQHSPTTAKGKYIITSWADDVYGYRVVFHANNEVFRDAVFGIRYNTEAIAQEALKLFGEQLARYYKYE